MLRLCALLSFGFSWTALAVFDCGPGTDAILDELQLNQLKQFVLAGAKAKKPEIVEIEVKNANPDSLRFQHRKKLVAQHEDGKKRILGNIEYSIVDNTLETQSDTTTPYRGLKVNRLILAEILKSNPEVRKIKHQPVDTNEAFLVTGILNGKPIAANRGDAKRFENDVDDRAQMLQQLRDKLANARSVEQVKDLREKIVNAAMQGFPAGINYQHVGFGRLESITIKQGWSGSIYFECLFARGERDDATAHVYVDQSMNSLTKLEYLPNGKLIELPRSH